MKSTSLGHAGVFISYSHEDLEYLQRLQVHLRPLTMEHRLRVWADSELKMGDQWESEITAALRGAAAAILLVSADFLASDFIAKKELPLLIKKAREHHLPVIPVFVQHCSLPVDHALLSFQCANTPAHPLSRQDCAGREEVYARVRACIEDAFLNPSPKWVASHVFGNMRDGFVSTQILALLYQTREAEWGLTFSELHRQLGKPQRGHVVAMVEDFKKAGWVVSKTHPTTGPRLRITDEGSRQFCRILSSINGPLRI